MHRRTAGHARGRPALHEWWLAFAHPPQDETRFAKILDDTLRKHNPYYDDLRRGAILAPARLVLLRPDAFVCYMKSIGRLDPQSKVPRLSNDRQVVDALRTYVQSTYAHAP